MKRFYNYTFQLVCVYILVLAIFSIFNFDLDKTNYNRKAHNVNEKKVLDSTLLVRDLQKEDKGVEEESIKKDEVNASKDKQEETESEVKEVYEAPKPVEISNVNVIDVSGYPALASETVNISHYGHDCYGCEGGETATGYYIGDGRTYYNDSTFGSVKVAAADSKYPYGTILRLSHNGYSYAAIVLDRGGSVGDHGQFQVDILASSESEAARIGSIYSASLEVLRYGY